MLLGCIGDDFTGSSDIASMLAKNGMSVTQYNGVPKQPAASGVDAGVVSLKSRTIPAQDAIDQSLEAAEWLLQQGCSQIFFKYCSTFDSTREGNIGPVAEALAEFVGEESVLVCPAFPATGRTVYQGHLFVNDTLLAESSLKDHPLTPMTDSDIRRWLSYQAKWPVEHVPHAIVATGSEAVAAKMNSHSGALFVADAICDQDLMILGKAAAGRKLLTGGSGLAMGLPENFRQQGKLSATKAAWRGKIGRGVVLSGSCSAATRDQVSRYHSGHAALELSAGEIVTGVHTPSSVCKWVLAQSDDPLVYTSADPDIVRSAQTEYGPQDLADKIEGFFGALAIELVSNGIERLVTAGGETSGAVVTALAIEAMEIGPEIAPGVPALMDTKTGLTLALKSGNFGGENFFEDALKALA